MKAPRDMTRKEFSAAMKRHGFYIVLFWICSRAKPEKSIGVVCSMKGKIHRRATLAKAIKEFET